jgi:AraC-like DNA-binding protein
MALLLASLPAQALLRLRRALAWEAAAHARHQLVVARDWGEMREIAHASSPQLAIFDPYALGEFDWAALAEFRAHFPYTVVLPYGDFSGPRTHDVLRLPALGIGDLVLWDVDDAPAGMRARIADALTSPIADAVFSGIADLLPARLAPFLRSLLRATHQPLEPEDAAQLYHRCPNTLWKHLRSAGLPPVNKLIVWTRLCHAAYLLGDSGRTVENVADVLGFPCANALRNQMQRYAGVTPREVRAGGGLPLLLAAFRERHRAGSWETGGVVTGQAAQSGEKG